MNDDYIFHQRDDFVYDFGSEYTDEPVEIKRSSPEGKQCRGSRKNTYDIPWTVVYRPRTPLIPSLSSGPAYPDWPPRTS
ncbi:hypothetical protein [Nocardia tenerifensis]|uniref:hypothetical protein n=1 Tax=Nocardia tenerifensis TaxID=228006 RepID=UPI001FE7F9D2|nr:hypothetical protein [Nocardia tenerifensis]